VLTEHLRAVSRPVVAEIVGHPFWAGLRDGSLPATALAHFVTQDTGHLLPALGRAFARCAAAADIDSHTKRLSECAYATVESAPRLRAAFGALAEGFGVGPLDHEDPADPTTLAYCSFLNAAAATSFPAGIGAVLPMMWFHMDVCEDLAHRYVPGSRYVPWIDVYNPGERAWPAVREFLGMVDEIGAQASETDRDQLVRSFSAAARYEWAFADGGWAASA
jgi:thiaminase (transcriptional activator TenA)